MDTRRLSKYWKTVPMKSQPQSQVRRRDAVTQPAGALEWWSVFLPADPCRLVRQVKKWGGWDALATELSLRRDKPAGGATFFHPSLQSSSSQEACHEKNPRRCVAVVAGRELRDANAGRTTIEMICVVFASHRLGSQRVTFPLKTRENPLTKLT